MTVNPLGDAISDDDYLSETALAVIY